MGVGEGPLGGAWAKLCGCGLEGGGWSVGGLRKVRCGWVEAWADIEEDTEKVGGVCRD